MDEKDRSQETLHHRGLFRRARGRDERGAIAVEFALIAPILILLVLGIIEFGFSFHAWDATQNAAREGARLGAVDASPADIADRVRGTTDFLNPTELDVTVQCRRPPSVTFAPCSTSAADWLEGDIVRVTVDYSYDFITPLPNLVGLGSQMDMRSISEARFEGI